MMDALTIQNEKHNAIFLDYGVYAQEGFTSGLLIIFRELLSGFKQRGQNPAILSFCGVNEASKDRGLRVTGSCCRSDQEIPIIEHLMKKALAEYLPAQLSVLLDKQIALLQPKFILIHPPSVFLDHVSIEFFKAANRSGAKVITVLGDPLFPRASQHPKNMVEALYAEISKTEVIGVGDNTRAAFTEYTGIPTKRLINPFTPNSFSAPMEKRDPQYIAMVNLHPIKGRIVFDEIAKMLPDQKFLIVKNWPDVPPYFPSTPNVVVSDFYKNPREFYEQVKILLVPSLWGEGPARVVTEAMYNHIPVIAHDIGSLGEFKNYGVHLVVPPSISGYDLVGTILYPQVSQTDVTRAAADFVSEIKKIISSSEEYVSRANAARESAEKYINESQRSFSQHFRGWLEGHPCCGAAPYLEFFEKEA